MPTGRGWAAFGTGIALWVAARFMGSPDLHMVAVGVFALPFLAALFVQWNRLRLDVRRELSAARVFPGTPVTVTLTVTNHGPGTVPFLLLEDAVPAGLGRPARLVVGGIPPKNDHVVSYRLITGHRGRYTLGPTSMWITDPFGLARVRSEIPSPGHLVVYPRVEDAPANEMASRGPGRGEAKARQLHHSAAEFYTMREYMVGDDLRRIHWPSVARTGDLMIRQDEASSRSAATLFIDNRASTLGGVGSPGFERAVSIGASVGRELARSGFTLHFSSVGSPTEPVGEEALLETLAGLVPARERDLGGGLSHLKGRAITDSSLVLIAAPPAAREVDAMIRTGGRFGGKTAVLVYPHHPSTLRPEAAAELEGRAQAAMARFRRARWLVCVVRLDEGLAEAWSKSITAKRRQLAGSSF